MPNKELPMLSAEQIKVQYAGFTLLDSVTFFINPKDKIGLIGKNGSGKSTLMKIIAGIQQPTSGLVNIPAGTKIGYLSQYLTYEDSTTLIEEVKFSFEEINNIKADIKNINTQLENREDYESDSYHKLIDHLTELNERYDLLGGDNLDADIEQVLTGLGFENKDFNRLTSEFSGGWRMRIELAKILLKRPEILLLDEPTNHLDIEAIQWFEEFIKNYNGSVLLVSHDKAFLDNVTNRTIEISLGNIYDYNLPYTKFVEQRKEIKETQLAAYKNQQKTIKETEEFIEKFRYKATKAVQVQSRIKQLEKMEKIEVEEEDNSTISISFPPAPRSGDFPVKIRQLSKRYDDLLVLDDINLTIKRGEKVAFVGRNGEGKTTLSKIITGNLDYNGECTIGHNVSIGYYAQNQEDLLDGTKTVFETIDYIARGDIRTKIRDILGAFLFRGEDVDKKVKVLSGGEKSRLAIATLLFEPYNLLLLDEPTNHLDMYSKEILKKALENFTGTVIVVSHDRSFLEGLVDKIYEFRNKKVKEHLGGIYDFLNNKKIHSLREIERKNPIKKQVNSSNQVSKNKIDYLEKKEFDKKLRKAQSNLVKSEKQIEDYENQLAKMNQDISENQISGNPEAFYNEYEELKNRLTFEMTNWEKLAEEYEKLQSERHE